jgi:hypothetical protein
MTVAYKEKIVEAFRDNAIRSVLLIDDEYLPYQSLVINSASLTDKLNEIGNYTSDNLEGYRSKIKDLVAANHSIKRCGVAKDFVSFFHDKKKICDVESDTTLLDFEKIRKSDLVVLDYFLDPTDSGNEAKSSLNLISQLSKSKHMNVVVVYTGENLSKVWLEIAATLRGSKVDDFFQEDEQLLTAWDENALDWEDKWSNVISEKIKSDHLISEADIDSIFNELRDICEKDGTDTPKREHVEYLLELSIKELNKNSTPLSELSIHGKKEMWVQGGDVFIVLCSKSEQITPIAVWESIENALHDWNPSFYRIVTSELQNRIEDANLSMEKVLSKECMEQISVLWGILRIKESNRERAAKEMMSNLLIDVAEKIQNNSELINFITSTANSTSEELPEFIDIDENREKHYNYINKMLDIAAVNYENINAEILDRDFRCKIVHAFNEQLCTIKEDVSYISTGVVIKDIGEQNSYYLCIAPSCNTVPNQITGSKLAKEMAPHRAMRFIKLKVELDLRKALKTAHQSDTIFITDNENRLALKIYESEGVPAIEQGVVVNHDDIEITPSSPKTIQFIVTNPTSKALEVVQKQFQPVAKLRAGFASRYQNTQLQYEARIGVDFVSAIVS